MARWTTDAAHDLGHIRRVWRNAQQIVEGDGLEVDQDVLRASVVFHDLINLPKDHPERKLASQHSAQEACAILAGLGVPAARLVRVRHAIEAHSFSAGIPPESVEARVLRDADRLDALGAIGVARMMSVAGQLGRAMYDPDDPMAERRELNDQRWAIDHFETKLFRLADDMLTQTARMMAEERIAYMRKFRDQLLSEL